MVKSILGQTDSVTTYTERLLRTGRLRQELYAWQGQQALNRGDTADAIRLLQKVLQHSTQPEMHRQYTRLVLRLLEEQGQYEEALRQLQAYRAWTRRADLPNYNFLRGELFRASNRPDSAARYNRIAQNGGDPYIYVLTHQRLHEMNPVQGNNEARFRTERDLQFMLDELDVSLRFQQESEQFDKLKLLYEMKQLKISRQKHLILLISLALAALLASTVAGLVWLNHRKKLERRRLQQENLVLRQQEEIARLQVNESELRAQAAAIREELLRRIKVAEKLPLLHPDEKNETGRSARIHLSDEDWRDLQAMVDSTYRQFTRRLREQHPDLTEKDVQFCCLLKVNMGLQTLADIYCISKTSVSKKKLRLKEKLGLTDAGTTLDEWLQAY